MNNLGNKDIDYLIQIYNYMTLAISGCFGVFIRHFYIKKNDIIQNILEYIAGALCSIYGSDILSGILANILIHYNFYINDYDTKQKLLSLSAFLCGMFGLSLCECAFNYFKK